MDIKGMQDGEVARRERRYFGLRDKRR